MARRKLNYHFHNPNTDEETIKYLTSILAESILNKVSQINREVNTIEERRTA